MNMPAALSLPRFHQAFSIGRVRAMFSLRGVARKGRE